MLFNILYSTILLFVVSVISKITLFISGETTRQMLLDVDNWQALVWGFRFDITAVMVLATLCLLIDIAVNLIRPTYSKWRRLPLILAGVWIIATTFSDYMYFVEAGRHITFEIFTTKGSVYGLISTCFTSFLPQTILVFSLSALFIGIVLRVQLVLMFKQRRALKLVLFFLIWPLLTVTAVRGGYQDAPQSPMSAFKIASVEKANIAWNAPYAITYYLAKGKKYAAKRLTPHISEQEVERIQQQLVGSKALQLDNLHQKNVVVVLLESWAAVDLHSYAHQIDAAPFFDQLRKESFSTHAMYSNGFRTVEGMLATMCSISNPIGGGVAGTQLQNNHFNCLPQVLRDRGWDTRFIQGSGKGIIGAFGQTLGFEYSLGKKDYDFESRMNNWGYMDDGIYRFSLQQMAKAKEPFFVTINTGTTHDTYLADEEPRFGTHTRALGRRSATYSADSDLKDFIAQLKQQMQSPTLVVLVADHTANVAPHQLDQFSIPFLMFTINDEKLPTHIRPITASHRDIAPTVLDWLGGEVPWFYGQSMLDPDYEEHADISTGTRFHWFAQSLHLILESTSGELLYCERVKPDTVTAEAISCDIPGVDKLYHQAKDYLLYSQQQLFEDKVID